MFTHTALCVRVKSGNEFSTGDCRVAGCVRGPGSGFDVLSLRTCTEDTGARFEYDTRRTVGYLAL